MTKPNFVDVTEISGDEVTAEQVKRLCHRYVWAGQFCSGKDVVEAACGTGQGAGYLAGIASSYNGGDFSDDILSIARGHYGTRIDFRQFDAQKMPFPDSSVDVVILFEALYYLPSGEAFVEESRRVLRPGGKVLIATANKDLFDFNPSPHSHIYYGVKELGELFGAKGFAVECFGCVPTTAVSLRQKLLRPVKKLVVSLGLMPRTMAGKKLLKRLVFGSLVPMPPEITSGMISYEPPLRCESGQPDRLHKVLYCVASLPEGG